MKSSKSIINPDIQKERDTVTFNIEELADILSGGHDERIRNKQIGRLLNNLITISRPTAPYWWDGNLGHIFRLILLNC